MITDTGVAVPQDMADALENDPAARDAFLSLRPDDQRSYVDWLAKPGVQSRSERLEELADHVRNHTHRPAPEDWAS